MPINFHPVLMRNLDPKQLRALELFQKYSVVSSAQIAELFGFKGRTVCTLSKKWRDDGFLEIVDSSKKSRKYSLSETYTNLI